MAAEMLPKGQKTFKILRGIFPKADVVYKSTLSQRSCHSSCGLVAGFPPRRPGFDPRSGDVGFGVEKVALGQALS
jgi:hypothetical protein